MKLLLWAGLAFAVGGVGRTGAPVSIVFDTDMGNDVDDALALGLLHAEVSRGECRILAITLTNPDPLAGEYVSAVDAFYGQDEIPIGICPDAPRVSKDKFLKLAANYPHRFHAEGAPLAVPLLRQVLAAAPDHSVVIAQTGTFTNLARLLASPPDATSDLSGRDLVARKVRLLSVMAGAFQPIRGNAHYKEFNVKCDIPSAQREAADWPTPIVWSGFEIGVAIPYSAWSVDHDFAYVPHHPVQEAYQLYHHTPHERPTWDVTSAWYAIFPDRGDFTLSEPGRVTVAPDGFTAFAPAPNGRDRYLKVDPKHASELRGLFAALVSQPPERK